MEGGAADAGGIGKPGIMRAACLRHDAPGAEKTRETDPPEFP
jgi:hypothetical protein